MILDELAAAESEIERSPRSWDLEPEIAMAYQQIHRSYADCLATPDLHLEALKRAVFLQWYSLVEPPCVSGIPEPDARSCVIVLRALSDYLDSTAEEEFDPELRWMLNWYYAIADYAFDGATTEARQWFAAHATTEVPRKASPESLESRGAMGSYFISLLP